MSQVYDVENLLKRKCITQKKSEESKSTYSCYIIRLLSFTFIFAIVFIFAIRSTVDMHILDDNLSISLAKVVHPESVSLCVMSKDEELDIAEFLEYHKRIGFDKAYVLDNNSTSAAQFSSVLSYVKSGFVEYIWFVPEPGRIPQIAGYELCMKKYGHAHTWMAFIDVDEFIVLKAPFAFSNIKNVLCRYKNEAGVTLNWMSFDSSGHVKRPQGGVLANYRRCQPTTTVKSIIKPRYALYPRNAHQFVFQYGYNAVDVSHHHTDNFQNPDPQLLGNASLLTEYKYLFDIMHINHYHGKSREDYARKKTRGDVFYKNAAKYNNVDAYANITYSHDCELLVMPK